MIVLLKISLDPLRLMEYQGSKASTVSDRGRGTSVSAFDDELCRDLEFGLPRKEALSRAKNAGDCGTFRHGDGQLLNCYRSNLIRVRRCLEPFIASLLHCVPCYV